MSITASDDNEDAGGAEGWTIDNQTLLLRRARGSWLHSTAPSIQIRVNGHFTRTGDAHRGPIPTGPLVPDEVGDEGGEFRLLFLTSGEERRHGSTDIETYNTFVQAAAAAGH